MQCSRKLRGVLLWKWLFFRSLELTDLFDCIFGSRLTPLPTFTDVHYCNVSYRGFECLRTNLLPPLTYTRYQINPHWRTKTNNMINSTVVTSFYPPWDMINTLKKTQTLIKFCFVKIFQFSLESPRSPAFHPSARFQRKCDTRDILQSLVFVTSRGRNRPYPDSLTTHLEKRRRRNRSP